MTAVPDPDPDPDPESDTDSNAGTSESGLDTDARRSSRSHASSSSTSTSTAPPPSPDQHMQILPFELQETEYCVETNRVSRVLGVTLDGSLQSATDPWYAGEVSFESRWKQSKSKTETETEMGTRTNESTNETDSETRQVRVVDLARVFSSPTAPIKREPDAKLLVFETTDDGDRHFGWLVDDVDITTVVRDDQLTPTRSTQRFVTGRIDHDGTTLVWLDDQMLNS